MDEFKADEADRKLRELFATAPPADNGFSDKVLHRVRRDASRRRWLMSLAVAVGAWFAIGPLLQLLKNLGMFLSRVDGGLAVATAPLAAVQTTVAMPLIGALLLAILAAVRLLED